MEEHKPFVEAGLERRKYERVRLYLPGLLLDPLNDQTYECKILNLSASGAGIQCAYTFRLGQLLLLQTDNFGRFEGKVSRCVGETLGFCLIMEAKQGRLIEMLGALAKGSTAGFNKRRKYQRICSLASGSFVRESGKYVACDVLDLSLDGASLRTEERPPVGEIVNLGRFSGRVLRHHDQGIALQYVRPAQSDSP
jgi:hypothetical protein